MFMRYPGKKSDDDTKQVREEYADNEIIKDDLEEVSGGFGENLPPMTPPDEFMREMIRSGTENPDAKKEKGDYKKTR